MGLTKVTAQITNIEGQKPGYEALFLVDTGAVHCLAPRDELQKAGIKPEGKAAYELADGQAVEFEYSFVKISFIGDETVNKIIFGSENTEPVLGALALASVGIRVDPVTKTLKRMPLSLKPFKTIKQETIVI